MQDFSNVNYLDICHLSLGAYRDSFLSVHLQTPGRSEAATTLEKCSQIKWTAMKQSQSNVILKLKALTACVQLRASAWSGRGGERGLVSVVYL